MLMILKDNNQIKGYNTLLETTGITCDSFVRLWTHARCALFTKTRCNSKYRTTLSNSSDRIVNALHSQYV